MIDLRPIEAPTPDEIEDARQRVAAAVAAIRNTGGVMHEWISVEDQLPEFDADVLLVTKDRGVLPGYLCSTDLCPWRLFDGRQAREEITHWMDYPQPPK